MNYILEFKNYYKEGDKILIEYWYDSHLTPVIIKEIKHSKFLVSHKIPSSKIFNAPDEWIKKSDIIDSLK
jgi:hypothetical protein